MQRNIKKDVLVYIIIMLTSIIVLIYGVLKNNSLIGTISINIGTSILASVIIYFILNFFIGDPLKPIVNSMEKINMGLSDTVSLLGQASETGLQGVWNNRSDLGTKEWIRILDESHGDIDILCYAMTFLPEDPNFNKI